MSDDMGETIYSDKSDGESISIEKIDEILLNTQEQCQMMNNLIQNQIQEKDNLINKLHAELQGYKDDHTERYVSQLMKEIITIRQNMKKTIAKSDWNEKDAQEIRKEYQYVTEDLMDFLERQGVDEYTSVAGAPFDSSIHQVVKTETTTEIELDKTVKESLSAGYRKDNKSFLLERVVVYKYENK